MNQVIALARREMSGLLTQRWILILLALLGMQMLIGVGARINYGPTFDLGNVAVTMAFLGTLAVMGLSLDAITKERTSGALDIILTRAVSRRQVIAGKLLAYLLISVPLAVLGVLLPMGAAVLLGSTMDFSKYPLELVIAGTVVLMALFATVGVTISLFCRTLQSAFAVGGALWVFFTPLVWDQLVLRALSKHISETALAYVNAANPVGVYFSAVQVVEGVRGTGGMDLNVPTWWAYAIILSYLAVTIAVAALMFDRQEEPGYAE